MIYLKWLLLIPVMLVVTVLTFPLALVLPFFAVYREGLLDNNTKKGMGWYLKPWLNWFQTPDNSIDGDEGWRTEHWQWRFKLPAVLAQYVGRVGWLWRNPGYGVGVETISGDPIEATYTGNKAVNDSTGVEGYCFVRACGLFQWVWIKRISAGRCIYINCGWNIKGLIDAPTNRYIATFAFSPRVSRFGG